MGIRRRSLFRKAWYVRPFGGSYGSENGTSYQNAWDGLNNINWNNISAGDDLHIIGTFSGEYIIVGASGTEAAPIRIYGYDSHIIASGNSVGFTINARNYITLNGVKITNANISCIEFTNTIGIITNNCIVTNSGNQGIQHLSGNTVTHNNPTCLDCVDDGISSHDAGIITINGGTFTGNSEGIAIAHTSSAVINGPITFKSNAQTDLTTLSAGLVDVYNVVFDGEVDNRGGNNRLTNCTIPTLAMDSGSKFWTLQSCFVGVLTGGGGTVTANNCLFTGNIGNGHDLTLNKCRLYGLYGAGKVTARHTLFYGEVDHVVDSTTDGGLDFAYCIFAPKTSGKFGIWARAGSTGVLDFHNNTIVPTILGRGWYNEGSPSYQLKNCIISGVQIVDFSGNQSYANCCFYNNDDSPSGTNDNPVTGDPLLTDVANLDFSLGVGGSSCIGTGLDLGSEEYGIDASTDWGNGVDELPVVVTKLQTNGAWDIGAYIS